MKTLILLRHAQAGDYRPDDHGRELTERGQSQARAAGEWLRDKGYRPDYYLCSTAMRTRQTLAGAMETLGVDVDGEITDDLYNHRPADYLRTVHAQKDDVDVLLLVGHNPDICQMTASLAGRDSEQMLEELIEANFPKSAIAVLTADINSWASLRLRSARLADMFMPAV